MILRRLLPLYVGMLLTLAVNSGSGQEGYRGEEWLKQWFRNKDVNGDGVLTPEELGKPRLFQRLDTNGDGKVTMDEARAFLRAQGMGDQGGPGRGRQNAAPPDGPENEGGGGRRYGAPAPNSSRADSAPSSMAGVEVYRDIPYSHASGVDPKLLSLDVYAPKGKTPSGGGRKPVVVMIHGGGWQIGDKAHADIGPNKARLFVSNNIVYVSINYRLSVRHPAPVRDVASALAWVARNITRYSGDPDHIYVMGHSSGAQLAALVATDERYLRQEGFGLPMIKGVVLLDSGGYDIPRIMNGSMAERGQEMYTAAFGSNPKTWADASPSRHVASGKGIPPALVFYVNRPRSADSSRDFVRALKSSGVPAAAIEAQGRGHTELNQNIGRPGDGVTRLILDFVRGRSPAKMPASI